MAYSLDEGFARITYTGITTVHHQMIPLNFAAAPTPGIEPNLTTRGGGSVGAVTGITDWVAIMAGLFSDETSFGLVEVYSVDTDDEERHFIYGFDVATIGTSANPNVALAMATMTFKTTHGNRLNLCFMESTLTVNQKLFPPFTAIAPLDDIAGYMVSADCIIVGRDDNNVFAPISVTSKTSDALRKHAGL